MKTFLMTLILAMLFGTAQAESQTRLILYQNSQGPLIGSTSMASWNWPGVALTAGTVTIFGNHLQGKQIESARWVVSWNPSGANTSIRLVSFLDGPTGIWQAAQIPAYGGALLRVDAVDITDTIQHVLNTGAYLHYGQQTYGNNVNGCLIYSSWIDIVWVD